MRPNSAMERTCYRWPLIAPPLGTEEPLREKAMMSFELDHVFICTDIDAPEADRLRDFGLAEGEPNVHPGQGTTNRRFFFHNVMLELVWVHNPEEAQSIATRPTRLWNRWDGRHRDAVPFGICLRPQHPTTETLPFAAWAYAPTYLPSTWAQGTE